MSRRKKYYKDDFTSLFLFFLSLSILGVYFRFKDFWESYGYMVLGGLMFILALGFVFIFHGYVFSRHSKATWYALKLNKALKRRGITTKLEYFDGHKHIDISIPDARIAIEVDGKQHYIKAKQIESDFGRKRGSFKKGIDTIHIPNVLVRSDCRRIARAIAEVAKRRVNV